jgi:hypothetical protein
MGEKNPEQMAAFDGLQRPVKEPVTGRDGNQVPFSINVRGRKNSG